MYKIRQLTKVAWNMRLSKIELANLVVKLVMVNTLRSGQDGRHFPDDIFKCIFLNEDIWIVIKISLKFVSKGPINNIPAMVQIMAWRRLGDKPLSEPMMISLLTHIYVTRPQDFNSILLPPRAKYSWRPRLIVWLLMFWFLVLSGDQQPLN